MTRTNVNHEPPENPGSINNPSALINQIKAEGLSGSGERASTDDARTNQKQLDVGK